MVWRKGHQVLAAGSHLLLKDDRFNVGPDNTLQLTDIQPQDAGDFVCQISLSAGETLEIAHTVEVLGKPRILSYVNISRIGGIEKSLETCFDEHKKVFLEAFLRINEKIFHLSKRQNSF